MGSKLLPTPPDTVRNPSKSKLIGIFVAALSDEELQVT